MVRLALLCVLGLTLFAAKAEAQHVVEGTLIEEPDVGLRLESWFALNADREASAHGLRIAATSLLVAGGGLELGLASSLSSEGDAWWRSALLTIGLVTTTVGTVELVTELLYGHMQRDRYARFQRARANGWNDTQRAIFETEWRTEIMQARHARFVASIAGFGICAIGAGLAVVASQYDSNTLPTRNDYVGVGAAIGLFGCTTGFLSLITPEAEQDLEDFDAGMRRANEDEIELSVAPLMGPSQLGVSVAGRF
ncbi:MAG: hypothetical protein IPK60_11530 [Sandaracinaceae bacterium]|nr:hypothetical protein [Sandaracinaceae bacterium]